MARRPHETAEATAAENGSVESDDSSTVTRVYRKKDLIDAVTLSSGVKKKTVKPVVDAVLAEIGLALAQGDALNIPPLGKLIVNRSKEGTRADVMIVKVRRMKPGSDAPAAGSDMPDDEDDGATAQD